MAHRGLGRTQWNSRGAQMGAESHSQRMNIHHAITLVAPDERHELAQLEKSVGVRIE